MWRNYFKIAYRYLLKQRAYAFINVFGLAVGMAACLLILLYVQDELGYDAYQAHADRIVRVTHEWLGEDGSTDVHQALIGPPVAPLLKRDFPEVEAAVRLSPIGPLLSLGDTHVEVDRFFWSDPELFDVLTVPLLAGDPETALAEPFTVVLSEDLARRLFGEVDVVGRTLTFNTKYTVTVTGVFKNLPHNTHLHADAFGGIATLVSWFGDDALAYWDSPNYLTYVRLAEGVSPEAFEQKLPAFLARHRGEDAQRSRLRVQPVRDIHLHSQLASEIEPGGDVTYVYLLSGVAALILLIACINFMNLATARSATRAKEVGLRKVVGASRRQLVGQFLGESVLTAFLALVLALVLVELALPAYRDLTGKPLDLRWAALGGRLAVLAGIGLVVGLAAGSYPAFFLSSFRPVSVLKGHAGVGVRGRFRSVLVVAQFAIAIFLLVGTFAVYDQLAFVRSQQLGFDKEHVVILPVIREIADDFEPLRARLLQHPDIVSVSQSNQIPSMRLSFVADVEADLGGDRRATGTAFPVFVDPYYLPTYGITLVAGRNFDPTSAEDAESGFILNETAARSLGWSDPADAVGHAFTLANRRGRIVGVVEDFYLESLHQAIAPMALYMVPDNYRRVSIRFRSGDIPGLIAFLEDTWQTYEPNWPLSYSFLDERFDALYRSEERLGRVFGIFAGLAVVITCLGLFGMAAFTVEQRTKEIGIRKVLGASVPAVVLMLSKEFSRLVIVAFVVAAPLGYFAVTRWMDQFAYHTGVSWGLFLLAGAVAFAVAWLTVSYQSIRAAVADPVTTLRYE